MGDDRLHLGGLRKEKNGEGDSERTKILGSRVHREPEAENHAFRSAWDGRGRARRKNQHRTKRATADSVDNSKGWEEMKLTIDGQVYTIRGFASHQKTVYLFLSEDGQSAIEVWPEEKEAYLNGDEVSYPEGLMDDLWEEDGCGNCRYCRQVYGDRICVAPVPAAFVAASHEEVTARTMHRHLTESGWEILAGPTSASYCRSYQKAGKKGGER